MTIQRHYLDQLMLSLHDKEAAYDAGPAGWTAASACSMLEFDDASAHEEWDDGLAANDDVVNQEFATRQEIARQGLRINYSEPRAKPNSMAGLMGLALGTVASVQEAALVAYRHKITPAAPASLPSIAAQTKHEGGAQYKYTGIKGDGYSLGINGPYMNFNCPLIGSGSRVTAADAFAAAKSENWLRWGDAKIFVKPTSGTAITIPADPVQGAVNLGASNVELSTRVLNGFAHAWVNALQGEDGYRAGSGKVRKVLYPGRRNGTITLPLEVDSASEATELDYYLSQTKLAFEFNLNSGEIIAATGAYKFGVIIVVPLIQFRTIGRTTENEKEVLTFEGKIMDDGTNDEIVAWVYNAVAAYLA